MTKVLVLLALLAGSAASAQEITAAEHTKRIKQMSGGQLTVEIASSYGSLLFNCGDQVAVAVAEFGARYANAGQNLRNNVWENEKGVGSIYEALLRDLEPIDTNFSLLSGDTRAKCGEAVYRYAESTQEAMRRMALSDKAKEAIIRSMERNKL